MIQTEPDITEIIKANFSKIFDEKIGIITEICETWDVLKTPFYSYYAASRSDGEVLYDGSGTSTDRDIALSKAIGECLERYCLSINHYRNFVKTKPENLSNRYPCTLPEKSTIYTQAELDKISFNCYSNSLETLFCFGYNCAKSAYEYVPLPMVYLRSDVLNRYPNQLRIIQQSISTGAAFGIEFYRTALTGIYEVIERDAMMAFWILGQEVPKIDLEDLEGVNLTLVKEIKKNDLELQLFDISLNEGITVILSCLKSGNPKMPSTVFSAAAHHNADLAIQKSIEEVTSTFLLCESLVKGNEDPYVKFLNPENWDREVRERNDHIIFWACHSIFNKFGSQLDFMFNSSKFIDRESLIKKSKNFKSNRLAFSYIVDFLAQTGYETILVDITASDIKSLGFMVLKAVIPGYLPLHLGHRLSYTRPQRLIEIARSVYKINLEELTLNNLPHPFP